MAKPKNYFHDHLVLALLSTNAFLTIAGSLMVLLRLLSGHRITYIVQYRSNTGFSNLFHNGTAAALLNFVAFAVLILVVHAVLSIRTYRIHRQLAVAILGLGLLLLVLNLIASNALLRASGI